MVVAYCRRTGYRTARAQAGQKRPGSERIWLEQMSHCMLRYVLQVNSGHYGLLVSPMRVDHTVVGCYSGDTAVEVFDDEGYVVVESGGAAVVEMSKVVLTTVRYVSVVSRVPLEQYEAIYGVVVDRRPSRRDSPCFRLRKVETSQT